MLKKLCVCVCVCVYVATEGILKDQEQSYHLGDFLTGWMRVHGILVQIMPSSFPFTPWYFHRELLSTIDIQKGWHKENASQSSVWADRRD